MRRAQIIGCLQKRPSIKNKQKVSCYFYEVEERLLIQLAKRKSPFINQENRIVGADLVSIV
jgi:hypothetical protein